MSLGDLMALGYIGAGLIVGFVLGRGWRRS